MKKLFTIIVMLLFCHLTFSQKADNYKLKFVKDHVGDNVVKIKCSFDAYFLGRDSLSLSFGGNLAEISVDCLRISKNIRHRLDFDNKKLILYKGSNDVEHITMKYVFANVSTTIVFRGSRLGEVWDIWQSDPSAEFYYPYIIGDKISYSIDVKCGKGLDFVISCPPSAVTYAPISIAFFKKSDYLRSEYDSCSILQIASQKASSEREQELSVLVTESTRFFEGIFSDAYASSYAGTDNKPVFFFHDGEGSVNRFSNGIIYASQTKFTNYPSILPLVHEIGHRWIGEYALYVEKNDCAPFLIESLNEFLTWQFVKDYYGAEVYEKLISECETEIQEYYEKHERKPLTSYKRNSSTVPIYNEGPMLLHRYAQKYGEKEIISAISEFYNGNKYRKDIKLEDFISALANHIGELAGKEFYAALSTL